MDAQGEVVKRYEKSFTPALHLYWPIAIARGNGVFIEATNGKRYLDFSSGLAVLNIGHSHPRVIDAVRVQLNKYLHTGCVYYSETVASAAERLISVTPAGLDMLFFSNSGAEAVEGALKLARFVATRQGIISFTGGFHGRTLGAVSVTTSTAKYRNRYHPLLPSVYHSPYPYCFRCPFRLKQDNCDCACFDFLEDILKPHMSERFERLRKMGLRTVMITGDNPLTAATIAKKAGVDDFLAEATPETKLAYIKK
ncbi:MAG: aminotransferase class III-fold pyridoxal phosphate-dependent enzyme, partial [Geobacteraceae bacterium]